MSLTEEGVLLKLCLAVVLLQVLTASVENEIQLGDRPNDKKGNVAHSEASWF